MATTKLIAATGSEKMAYHCPLCHGDLRRTWRQPVDRFASMFMPLHRYRCVSFGCGWEGNFRTHSHHARAPDSVTAALTEAKPLPSTMPVFVTMASAAMALFAALLLATQWGDVSLWVGKSAFADAPVTSAVSMPTAMGQEIPLGPRRAPTVRPVEPIQPIEPVQPVRR